MRGDCDTYLGVIYIFDSEATMKKYFPEPGMQSEETKAGIAKMKEVITESGKYLKDTATPDKYTDWIIL